MANPEGQGQELNQSEQMTLADLLRKLKTSGVEDLLSSQSPQILNINSAPQLFGQMFIDPEGHPVYTFGQKFEEGFDGWKPGDRVQTKFLTRKEIEAGTEKVVLVVSESITNDLRHSDIFTLVGLSPEDKEALVNLGIAELDATVLITSTPAYEISNMWKYTAYLDRINGVQKTFDGDYVKLERGPVLIEGEIIDYSPNMEYPYKDAAMTVRLANGQEVRMSLLDGYVVFESGKLDILNPDHPKKGDIVQINANYSNPELKYGREKPDILHADWCSSTYLLKPSEERITMYVAQRQAISKQLEYLNQLTEPQAIRSALSNIVSTNIYELSSNVSLGLRELEKALLRSIIGTKFKSEEEKPLDLLESTDIYEVQEINKVYGVDVFTMSRREFLTFCMQMARGKIIPIEEGSLDYPYRVLINHFPKEQQEEILQTAVITFADKVNGKKIINRQEYLSADFTTGYDPTKVSNLQNTKSDEVFLYRQSLSYLSYHVSMPTANIYINLARIMLEEGKFGINDNHELEFSEYETFSAMRLNIINNVQRQESQITSLKNIAVVKAYVSQLPMLKSLSERMKSEAWNNNGRYDVSSELDEVIEILTKVDVFLKQQNSQWN